MHHDLSPLLKNIPPRTFGALRQAIVRYGERQGRPAGWVQQWIGFVVVGDALARHQEEGRPAFELKGGAAIELRLHEQRGDQGSHSNVTPRATKDLDMVFRGAMDDIEHRVGKALAGTRHPFTAKTQGVRSCGALTIVPRSVPGPKEGRSLDI